MPKKFLRRNWYRLSRLGKKRKKKQVWRSPKGRHNKMRLKRKGYSAVVEIGYKKPETEKVVLVNNLRELHNLKKGEKIILGKIGDRKKMEIVKVAKEKGIHIQNLDIEKFEEKMKKMHEERKAKKESAKKVESKKIEKHSGSGTKSQASSSINRERKKENKKETKEGEKK